ncbi:MazG nucleotide pyrophosphohydrolase domain-containing protein [Enterococcus sp. OL5]|uniref:MazG nucleotide pyrophosphohydrolase domain-containing protein n=1 Tax=Enterococcus sp. OL5 TaxID=2590214 RepID=UPI00112975F2|nr:MazG nucleotide pyrophosphohydrolase domain-containing protein [Enterococcus sp. OL5]TPR55397.1 nucleotide pyrophosphohydrolase [Enterococcus sp. OL5]
MANLPIEAIQEYLFNKYKDKASPESLFMKLVEEIGEVAEALNQSNGRKSGADTSLEKELADVIHYTIAIASVSNIELSPVILEKDKEAAIKYGNTINLENFISNK